MNTMVSILALMLLVITPLSHILSHRRFADCCYPLAHTVIIHYVVSTIIVSWLIKQI